MSPSDNDKQLDDQLNRETPDKQAFDVNEPPVQETHAQEAHD